MSFDAGSKPVESLPNKPFILLQHALSFSTSRKNGKGGACTPELQTSGLRACWQLCRSNYHITSKVSPYGGFAQFCRQHLLLHLRCSQHLSPKRQLPPPPSQLPLLPPASLMDHRPPIMGLEAQAPQSRSTSNPLLSICDKILQLGAGAGLKRFKRMNLSS